MPHITRRQFTALSIAGVAGTLWGCTAAPPPAKPAASTGGAPPSATTGPGTVPAGVKREGLIVANIEDTYGHAAGMEAVAKEYIKLYPNVDIRIDPKPIEGYYDWAKAQVVGGTNASLMRDCSCPDLVAAGKFVDFGPHFEKVNPYTDKKWSTMFKPGAIRADEATGQVVQFNMFSVYVLWFYNKTLWEKVGLKDTPKTWTDLIKVLQTFKDAGVLPTPMAGDVDGWRRMGLSWLSRITADAYARESINIVRAQPGDWNYKENVDGAWKYDPKDPYNDAFGKVTRSPARMTAAFRDGTLKVDNPGYRDLWKHLKQFLQFVQPGYIGVNRETARQLFLTGKAGVWMDASWFFSQFEKFMGDSSLGLNRFDYGTFNLVDIDDSPLIKAPTRTIDNSAGYWVLPKKDQAQNDLEIDFLMFLSSPKMAGLLVETTLQDPKGDLIGPPMIEGVELSDVWKQRFSVIGGRGQAENGAPGIHGIDAENTREWVDLAQQYATDKIGEDQFFKQFQESVEKSVPRVAKAQGYDLDNPGKKPTPPR
ncbi:MAG: extracellular solute-binding protein [Chloroflexi bacterium]|nr:extracellular solute-binding protein [Chloroflexota bacterium]